MKSIRLIATLVAYFGLWPIQCGASDTPNAAPQEQVAVLVAEVCTECHSLEPIRRTVNGRGGWEQTVKEMIVRGAQLNSEDIFSVTQFLAESYGPGGNPMRTRLVPTQSGVAPSRASSVQLPDGKGKEQLQASCTACHDLGRIVSSRRGEKEWRHYVETMLARFGRPPSAENVGVIATYLRNYFGRNDRSSSSNANNVNQGP
jgi:hypothetical protein